MDIPKEEYQWILIEGISCIKTCFKNDGQKVPKKESERRRKMKTELGRIHVDTIMIDSNSLGKFCDAIICVSNIDTWIKVFKDLYRSRGYTLQEGQHSNAKQYTWYDCSDIHVVLNCYKSTSKLMVQGSELDAEGDILRWVRDFACVKDKILGNDCLDDISSDIDIQPYLPGYVPVKTLTAVGTSDISDVTRQ